MKRKRFPRFKLEGKVLWAEKILRAAYNKMRSSRETNLFFYRNYDVYKTKSGWRAMLAFKLLGEKLIQQNIDPALYIKVMCRFGKYKNSKWMPHPTWLNKDKTIEKFKWVYRRERRSYDLYLDWKKELDGWSELDIYAAIRDSAKMVKQAVDGRGVTEEQAVTGMWYDLSPWFLAMFAIKTKESSWKDFKKCFYFLVRHKRVLKIAKKAYKRSFQ